MAPVPGQGAGADPPLPDGTPRHSDEFESHLSQFLGAHPRRTGPLFRVQALTVAFGPLVAVNDVDLELNDGEIVAIVGPNGAGKTSLCDALGGFVAPSDRTGLLRGP